MKKQFSIDCEETKPKDLFLKEWMKENWE
jgi:hypothetical protein